MDQRDPSTCVNKKSGQWSTGSITLSKLWDTRWIRRDSLLAGALCVDRVRNSLLPTLSNPTRKEKRKIGIKQECIN
ncbi:hypothetical protein SeMB42_g01887 [Synchytrium endobioticum]|uniref:Uncharacterized protein n=1 Tax=Synchytrium endobioticum TaxID=286115 RepID=A0A507DIT7_9FUNG|nr:hypothetical protein SeMB42_g01887 [Synchytrium endobioticum]